MKTIFISSFLPVLFGCNFAAAAPSPNCPAPSQIVHSCEDDRPPGEPASAVALICSKSANQFFLFIGTPTDTGSWKNLMPVEKSTVANGKLSYVYKDPATSKTAIVLEISLKNSDKSPNAMITIVGDSEKEIFPGSASMICNKRF